MTDNDPLRPREAATPLTGTTTGSATAHGTTTSATSSTSGSGDDPGSGVKERARQTASQAGSAVSDVAGEAKDKAGDVMHEARQQSRRLVDQAGQQLRDQAQGQQSRLAEGLRSLGTELDQMAGSTEDPGYATDLVRRASETAQRAAGWFDDREPRDVLRDVQDFARRRPGTFLVACLGAGVLVGRLARSLKDAPSGDDRDRADRSGRGGTGEHRSSTAYAAGSDAWGAGTPSTTGTPRHRDEPAVPTPPVTPVTASGTSTGTTTGTTTGHVTGAGNGTGAPTVPTTGEPLQGTTGPTPRSGAGGPTTRSDDVRP